MSIFFYKFYKFVFGVKRTTGAFISEEKDYVTETVQQLKEEVRATRRQYVSNLTSCLSGCQFSVTLSVFTLNLSVF